MNKIIFSFLSLLLSGCVFHQQTAKLAPSVSVTESNTGNGKTVFVSVADERPDQSIGKRGVGGAGADIMPAENVEDVVRGAVVEGLMKKGFKVANTQTSSDSKLVVEVRFLQYALLTGVWTLGCDVKVALKATATNKSQSYDHFYRTTREERVPIAPTSATNEKWINEAISKTIQDLVNDAELLSVLARG